MPALSEQPIIADYIAENVLKLDEMVNKVEEVIDRLTEYRTALITAATTGKIDVRNVKIGSKE
ncbi:MAG: type I restriction endonuclease subunit S [Pseudomonadota bacterium]|nr:type I restriction endonuclease subunit S [Pseudomonadota bacterium]